MMLSRGVFACTIMIILNCASAEEVANLKSIEVTGNYAYGYKVDSVHSAMRFNLPILQTPQSVSVISAEIIQEQQGLTLGDALRNDASISVGRVTTDRERFSLRGFSLEEETNILIDGHQHFSKYRIPMALIDNVEVLKGPSGLLYGQSAAGGLVNLVTKKPTHEQLVELSIKGDDNGSLREMIDIGGSVNKDKTVRYRAILEKEDNKSWRRYLNGDRQESDYWAGSLLLDFDLGKSTTLSLYYSKSDEKAGQDSTGLVDENGKAVGGRETIWEAPWSHVDVQSENYGLGLIHHFNYSWQLATGIKQQNNDRIRVESKPKTTKFDSTTGTFQQRPEERSETWRQRTFYLDITGTKQLAGMKHNILIGGNYLDYKNTDLRVRGDKIDGNLYTGETAPRPNIDLQGDKKRESNDYYGLYIQDLITFNERWQALVGIRYDKQKMTDEDGNSASDNALLPKLAITYHPNEQSSIYASYSKSFEPQGRVTDSDDANFGKNLTPVYGEMFELGGKWEVLSGNLLLNAAIFDIKRKDIVINTGTSDNPISTQGGIQHHRGVEIGASGKVTNKLSLFTSLMYLDAEFEKHDEFQGNRPEDVAKFTAAIWSKYSFNDRTDFNLGAFYEGNRFGDASNEFKKDGYIRFDAGVSYAVPISSGDLQVQLNVENLFDKDYLGGGENGEVNFGRPRLIKLGLNYKY